MGVLILLDHRVCHVNPFQPACFLSKWFRSFQHSQDQVSVLLNVVCVIHLQVAFVFPPSLPLFFSKDPDSYSSIHFIGGSFSILFRQCSYPVILMKILMELQVRHSSFFSSPVDSSQVLSIISFSLFQIPSHTGAPHNRPLLAILLFWYLKDISEDSSCHSRSIQPISRLLSHSSHLNQPVQSLIQIVQRCIF